MAAKTDFLQRTAGPTVYCCDQKWLQTISSVEIQHGNHSDHHHHQLKMYSTLGILWGWCREGVEAMFILTTPLLQNLR